MSKSVYKEKQEKKGKKIEIRKLYISYTNNGDNYKETETYFNGCHIYVAVIFGAISVAVRFTKNSHFQVRSSHHRYSIKKVSVKISQNSQENTCVEVSFYGLKHAILLNKLLQDRCFPVHFAKFLIAAFSTEHLSETVSVRSAF